MFLLIKIIMILKSWISIPFYNMNLGQEEKYLSVSEAMFKQLSRRKQNSVWTFVASCSYIIYGSIIHPLKCDVVFLLHNLICMHNERLSVSYTYVRLIIRNPKQELPISK